MKIVSLQLPVRLSDVDGNLEQFKDALAQLSDEQDTIVILPEMWMCGFDYGRLTEFSERTDDVLKSIEGIINDNTLVISALPERNQNKVFNTVYAVSKNGVQAKYRKSFLFTPMREDEYIDKGNADPVVFDFKGVKVGLLLCYEIRFPEMFRMTAFAGADIIAVPAIWPQMKKDHWLTLMKARAIENQCYIAGCNTSVMHGKKDMPCGFSAAVDPWGEFLYEPSAEEGIYTAEADVSVVNDIRTKIPSFYDAKGYFDIKGKTS
ncbi:MAG: nitrilase-related carbon-nitrogen hydrolase [Deferribacterales bacterium]